MADPKKKYVMLTNVNHDGVNYPIKSACPVEVADLFVSKHWAKEWEAAPAPAHPEPSTPAGGEQLPSEKLAELKAKQEAAAKSEAEAAAKKAK